MMWVGARLALGLRMTWLLSILLGLGCGDGAMETGRRDVGTSGADAGPRVEVDGGPGADMDAGPVPEIDGGGPGPTPDAGPAGPVIGPDGVVQIYPTRTDRAREWYLGIGDWEARTRQFGDVTGTGCEMTVRAAGQVRFTVKAEASDCEGLEDHGRALSQGFMCSANDWRNWEMTGYLRMIASSPDSANQDFTMYGNGGRHTGGGPDNLGCLGSSYKASYDWVGGRVRFAKEPWHVNYAFTPWVDEGGPDLTSEDRFIGIKYVRYEFERGGAAGVRLEVWLDLAPQGADGCPANEWVLVQAHDDHPDEGPWGDGADGCGAPDPEQIMLWGGPWVTWRWDDSEAELRLMNVREILPPATPTPVP